MPFVTPFFVYLQFVYNFARFLCKKAAIKVETEIAAIYFFYGNSTL